VGKLVQVESEFNEAELSDLVGALSRGGTVCMATDTVYGLHCCARTKEAVKKIAGLKGREERGFILLVGEPSWLDTLTGEVSASARRLIERYWPGPLTLVFRALPGTPQWLLGPNDTVAVRWPGSRLCEQLFKVWRHPIVSTSANLKGDVPYVNGTDAASAFMELVDVVVDSGEAPSRLPSTVVDTCVTPHVILREGAIQIDPELL
jgi:L-threonylcarbamoyladenylate synthase